MIHLRAHVEDVDHHRDDCRDALVGGGGEPCRPPPLRSSGQRERLQRCVPSLACDLLHRVHRTDCALDHRQQQRPVALASLQVLIERVCNERIFLTVEHRLKRHLPQHADRRSDLLGQLREQQRLHRKVGLLSLAVVFRLPAAAGDKQQTLPRILLHGSRPQYEQLMLPRNAAPGLRRQQVLDVFDVSQLTGRELAPPEALIARCDVPREIVVGC